LKSYKDLKYRAYVINQLQAKKSNIEASIKKQQAELKILTNTIDSINDGNFFFYVINYLTNNSENKIYFLNRKKVG
jgi:hypothetical protein